MMKVNSTSLPYDKATQTKLVQKNIGKSFILEIIAKIALSILIIPLFIPCYYRWVNASIQLFKQSEHERSSWKNLAHSLLARREEALAIENRYKKLSHLSEKYFGPISGVPGDFGLHMPGVAIVTAGLAKRHNIKESLWVAKTIEHFQADLKQKMEMRKEGRFAYIVGATRAGHHYPNFPQHKMAIVVEIKQGETSVAILDPISTTADELRQRALNQKKLWAGWLTKGFGRNELILRALGEANLPANAKVYFSNVPREVSYGCVVFAVRDAIAFLKDPHFFSTIVTAPTEKTLSSGHMLHEITELPAAFIVGAQRSSVLQAFLKPPREKPETINVIGSDKSLAYYLDKYRLKINDKPQNHYITRKMFKYNKNVLHTLANNSEKLIKQKIRGVYLAK